MSREEVLARAKEALKGFSVVAQPISFVDTGDGERTGFPGTRTGSFRSKDGRALMVPVPESNSMFATFPAVSNFFTVAPEIIRELVEELEQVGAETPESEPNRPPKPPSPPKDREYA